MSDPYKDAEASAESETAMSMKQRSLARRIVEAVDEAECYADRRSASAWLEQQGAGLLRAALAEIERLEAENIALRGQL